MARTNYPVQMDKNGHTVDTPLVALSDDGDQTFRIYRGGFHNCLGGRTVGTYVLPLLWEGPVGDLTNELIESLINPQPAQVPKKVVRRTRRAGA